MTDRPLPHSPEAERAFLGGLILAGGEGPDLDVTDFHLPLHRSLYRSIRRLKVEGKPLDLVLLHDQLTPGEIEEAGGMPFIASLVNEIPRVSNLAHYAEIIKTKAAVRERLARCELILQKLWAANGDAAEVLQEISVLSVPLREDVGQKRKLAFKTGADLVSDLKVEWIVKGLLAKGAITELDAKIKLGKTTMILDMIRRVLGGRDFLDQPTTRTAVVYLTEQSSVTFQEARERAGLVGREDFHWLHFTDTLGLAWPDVAAGAFAQCKKIGAGVLIVDTISQFCGLTGERENNAGDALEAMRPLQQGAADGIGIVIVRHERKSGGDVGDSGRGSSTFAGAVDIILSLRRAEGNSARNRRLLQSLSRFSGTPNDLLIELTEDGYAVLGERREAAHKEAKDAIFGKAPEGEANAADLQAIALAAEIKRQTAQRAIEDLVRDGFLIRIGEGKRGSPFRYFRPENRFCPTPHVVGQEKQKPKSLQLPGHEWDPYRDPD